MPGPDFGKQMMVRDVIHLCRTTNKGKGWRREDLILMGATIDAESDHCHIGAFNLNLLQASEVVRLNGPDRLVRLREDLDPVKGTIVRDRVFKASDVDPVAIVSRGFDAGLIQKAFSVTDMDSSEAWRLRREPDYAVWVGWQFFHQPWPSPSGIRRFGPWIAFSSGWVTFPEWWVFTQAEPHHWAPTGRFLQRALRGWVNSLVLHMGHKVEAAIYHGDLRAREYGIDGRFVPGAKPSAAPIDWADVPTKPADPPLDGVGPRPVKNDGSR